jgi:sensor histidine kinase YesM
MKKSLTKNYFEVALHLLFWAVYFIYPIIKFGYKDNYVFKFNEALINTILIALSVYIVYFFISKNISKVKGFIILLLLFFSIVYLNCYLNTLDCVCNSNICFINKTVEYLSVNAFFIALFTIKKNIISQQKLERKEKERVQAELKSLKAQMNPHFLFNTLNMLYSNAIHKDEVLADKILKLSDSLHYLMHEGAKEYVHLQQEIDFIKGYIDLQKARLGKRIEVHFTTDIDNSKQKIPPLLLIPFIENAFKYSSMVEGEKIPIAINLKLNKGAFSLYVENIYDANYSAKQSIEGWKDSGIGIKNIKQRLDLLFLSKHKLVINSLNNKIFIVNLEIDLK